jgi:hypothetical protein
MDGRSMPKIKSLLLLTALAFALPTSVFASGGDRIPGSRYVSGRGAALGDAYIGLADGVADALFYNPAAIGKVTGFSFEPINLQLQANSKLNSMFGTDFYKFQNLKSYQDTLRDHPATNPGGGYAVLPNFGFPGFGFGMLYQARLMAERTGNNIRYRSVYQLIPAATTGIRLASGVLRLGYSLQWVNQASGDKTVALDSTPMGWKEGLAEGQGFSHNFAIAVTLPFQYQPSINIVARNIGGLSLQGKPLVGLAKNPTGTIAEEEMSVDASFGMLAKLGKGWDLAPQFVYRDATNSSATRSISHFSAGLEFTALEKFFLRGGFGNGYPSAGIGLRTSRAEANFAWFSEDLGDGVTPIRDIRYIFHVMYRVF